MRDVEVDVLDRVDTAETPADPPQAEGRHGVRLGGLGHAPRYFWIGARTLPLPAHGSDFFLHTGNLRPGGGVDGVNVPPNDWSTAG